MFIGIGIDLARGGGSGFFSGATLDMNFAAGAYLGKTPSALTVARTGTTGYAETSTGVLVPFAINTARITDKGLLVEEGRTNLAVQSQTFGTTWVAAAASVTSDAGTAPDGTQTADLITEDGTTAAHGVTLTITTASNVAFAQSVYYKPNPNAPRTWLRLYMDDAGGTNLCQAWFNCTGAGTVGTASSGGTGSGAAGSIQAMADGSYRCILTGTPSSVSTGSVRFLIRIVTANNNTSHAGDGVSGGYVWGAQLEAGAFATSYIPTTSAAQARGVDDVRLSGTAFSDWYTGGTSGAFLWFGNTVNNSGGSGNRRAFEVHDGTVSNRQFACVNSSNQWRVGWVSGGVSQADIVLSSPTFAGVAFKGGSRYAPNNFQISGNGTLGTQDSAGTAGTPTILSFGNDVSNTVANTQNGYTQRLLYVPSALADAVLQNWV